jgi:hypothetical protein
MYIQNLPPSLKSKVRVVTDADALHRAARGSPGRSIVTSPHTINKEISRRSLAGMAERIAFLDEALLRLLD